MLAHDFSRNLSAEQPAKVQAFIDGYDANTANVILGYVQGVTANYNYEDI